MKEFIIETSLRELFHEVGLDEPDWGSFFGRRRAAIARYYFDRKTKHQGRIAMVSELLSQAVKEGLAISWTLSECPGGACGPLSLHVGGKRIALVQ